MADKMQVKLTRKIDSLEVIDSLTLKKKKKRADSLVRAFCLPLPSSSSLQSRYNIQKSDSDLVIINQKTLRMAKEDRRSLIP